MDKPRDHARSKRTNLEGVREHLLEAQRLLDAINPQSVAAARLQHIIDELLAESTGQNSDVHGEPAH